MAFGSPLTDQNPTGRPARETSELLPAVRAAAENLVADLDRAEQLTRHWSDEKLTEALVESALSECLFQLAKTGCWGEANRLPSGELWRIAGPLLEVGSLQNHARLKPRGYAGDYEMLLKICAEYHCDDPLGRAFDRYFQRQAAPQAVRARTQQTAATLASHRLRHQGDAYHVVSVGAGPATDLSQAIGLLPEDHRRALRVTLLDLDPEALDCARQRIEPLLPSGALTCVRENLFRLAQRPGAGKILGTPDFLVCSGLFDYQQDETAVPMLRLFWQRLSGGGLLLVGNFAPHNPTRAYMEWIGNWYLSYRTAAEMERLGARAGIPRDQFSVGTERTGVDLFLIGRKPSRQPVCGPFDPP